MKKTTFFKKVIIVVLAMALAGSFVAVPRVSADENGASGDKFSFTMSPMKRKIVINPGESYTGSVSVFNPSSNGKDLEYTVLVEPFYVDEDYNPVYDEPGSYNQIVDWITIEDVNDGVLEPNNSAEINYTINVPLDAPAGGQYASITVAAKATAAGEGVSISEQQAIAHIVFAEIAGETVHSGEILDAETSGFMLSGDITASSTIKNTGNVHGTATYTLQVYPLFSSEEVYTNEEDPETRIIVPNRTLYNEISWPGTPGMGIFNVVYTVDFEGVTTQVSKMVIICPIWLMFVIIFVVVAIIIWIIWRARGRRF